jgi:UDP-N-acetylmuramate dehydrogenase
MKILTNVPLSSYATLRVGGMADFFVEVRTIEELKEALVYSQEQGLQVHVLGGGSNTLFLDSGFRGLVIHIVLRGKTYIECEEGVLLTACAGELWDEVVADTVERGVVGLENLSLIPGTVGGAVVQNIGAYGRELKDFVKEVTVFDCNSNTVKVLPALSCLFGYRSSIFKKEEGKNLIVLSVTFCFLKEQSVEVTYPDLITYIHSHYVDIVSMNASMVRSAVIAVRNSKLPSIGEYGTAGSFFKNPIISKERAEALKEKYHDLPLWKEGEDTVKVSAAYLIDKVANLKGISLGGAFVWEKQALVLVTKEGASGSDVVQLKNNIKQLVFEKSGVQLEEEVCIVEAP